MKFHKFAWVLMRYSHAVLFLALLMVAIHAWAEKPPVSVTIKAPVEQIKAAIVANTSSQGYRVVSDTPYQLVISKELTGFQGAMTQVLMGNEYANTPTAQSVFTFAPSDKGILVSLTDEVTVQMPFGRVNKRNLSDDKKARQNETTFLTALKVDLERSNTTHKVYLGVFFTSSDSVVLKEQ